MSPSANFDDVPDAEGFERLPPGEHLVVIIEAQERAGQVRGEPPTWIVRFQALEGDDEGGEITDYLKWTRKAMPRLRKLLSAVGERKQGDEAYRPGVLKGRVLWIHVHERPYQGKMRPEVSFAGFKEADEEDRKRHGDDLPF